MYCIYIYILCVVKSKRVSGITVFLYRIYFRFFVRRILLKGKLKCSNNHTKSLNFLFFYVNVKKLNFNLTSKALLVLYTLWLTI